jgi:hypothetical protein
MVILQVYLDDITQAIEKGDMQTVESTKQKYLDAYAEWHLSAYNDDILERMGE